jgi:hypothetical protein
MATLLRATSREGKGGGIEEGEDTRRRRGRDSPVYFKVMLGKL